MISLSRCVCGCCYHDKKKNLDQKDLNLGTVVVLDTMSKPVDFRFKRSGSGLGVGFRLGLDFGLEFSLGLWLALWSLHRFASFDVHIPSSGLGCRQMCMSHRIAVNNLHKQSMQGGGWPASLGQESHSVLLTLGHQI